MMPPKPIVPAFSTTKQGLVLFNQNKPKVNTSKETVDGIYLRNERKSSPQQATPSVPMTTKHKNHGKRKFWFKLYDIA